MKRFFALVALVLGLASCQTEPEGLDVQMGGAVDATITVNIPDSETRAGGTNSAGSIFDNVDLGTEEDTKTMRYILQIYDATGQASKDRQIEYSDGRSVNFDVHLVPGRHYSFVVWADYVESKDDTDFHYYTKDGLTNITLNGNWDAMDETRDAFTGVFNTAVHGSQTEYNGAKDIDITLTRPFAKLRVRTTDMKELFGGVSPHHAEVRYTTPHYDTFDALRGVASGARIDETHTYNIANYDDNVATGDKQTKTLFTDYFFANESGVVKFTMDVMEVDGTPIKSNTFNTDIAVKRNHLTTIEGNILTDGNKVNVTVEDTFGEKNNQHINYKTISSDKEFLDAVNGDGGKYIVISDLTIADAGTTVNNGQAGTFSTRADGNGTTINLNGYTITLKTDITIAEGKTLTITDINENGETGAIINAGGKIVNNGTLNIEGGNFGENTIENNETEGGKVNITGGTFESDPSEFVDSDYNVVENNGVYSLVLKDVIAKIGDVEYRTLQKAFDAVDNGTIQLVDDVTLVETVTLAEGKTVILDLNGKTLAHAEMATKYAINNLGTLTITGNGTVNSRGIYNGYGNGGENVATAKLTIENGTFNAKGEDGGAAIFNYGVVEVKGGKFESTGGYGLNNQLGASMTITGGEIRGGIYNCGTLSVDGENTSVYQHISGRHAIYNYAATAIINNGAFDSESGNELILADGENSSVTINGGTFDKTAKSWLMGAATGKNITFVINGGTFRGYVNKPEMTVDTFRPYGDPIVVCGGNFNFNPTQWLSEGYKTVEQDGIYTIAKDPAAVIGSEEYLSLQAAFEAVQDGDTIVLQRDITLTDEVINISSNVTLNLNGKKLDAAASSSRPFNLTDGANFTINAQDSEVINGYFGLVNMNNANLTINGGNFTGGIDDGAFLKIAGDKNMVVTLNNVTLNETTNKSRIINTVGVTGTNLDVNINGGYYEIWKGGNWINGTIDGATIVTVNNANQWEPACVWEGELTIKNSTLKGAYTAVSASGAGVVYVENCVIEGGTYAFQIMSSGGTIYVDDKTTYTGNIGTTSKVSTPARVYVNNELVFEKMPL